MFTATLNSGSYTITGITYNGVSLTQLGSPQPLGTSTGKFQMWYLVAPATGTNTLSISSSNAGNNVYWNAYSIYNAAQVAPEAPNQNTGASGSVTATTTPLTNGALVMGGRIERGGISKRGRIYESYDK